MKCPNCGGETNGAYCSYCGSEMPKQPINIFNNYYGNASGNQDNNDSNAVSGPACPNCGGTKISYNRESTGTRGLHQTVAVCKNCGNTWVTSRDVRVSPKNKTVALVICILLGLFGGHHFYVGKSGMGILYLFTAGLLGIGWVVDIINICKGEFKDANGYPLK